MLLLFIFKQKSTIYNMRNTNVMFGNVGINTTPFYVNTRKRLNKKNKEVYRNLYKELIIIIIDKSLQNNQDYFQNIININI